MGCFFVFGTKERTEKKEKIKKVMGRIMGIVFFMIFLCVIGQRGERERNYSVDRNGIRTCVEKDNCL